MGSFYFYRRGSLDGIDNLRGSVGNILWGDTSAGGFFDLGWCFCLDGVSGVSVICRPKGLNACLIYTSHACQPICEANTDEDTEVDKKHNRAGYIPYETRTFDRIC